MSTYGYMACQRCRQYIFLGKRLSDEPDSDTGFGFWHGKDGNSLTVGNLLPRKIMVFVAEHIAHQPVSYLENTKLDEIATDYEEVDDIYRRKALELEARILPS
jgi:hypothetical protein